MKKILFFALILIISVGLECSDKESTSSRKTPIDFTLPDLDGNDVKLSSLKGNVVLVDFWATWCPPCRVEIPHLITLYETYKGKGLVVLGVGLDDEQKLKDFAEEYSITYPILIGTKDLSQKYGIIGIPTTYLIDKKGKIGFKHIGFSEGLEKEMEREIKMLLEE